MQVRTGSIQSKGEEAKQSKPLIKTRPTHLTKKETTRSGKNINGAVRNIYPNEHFFAGKFLWSILMKTYTHGKIVIVVNYNYLINNNY